jgi:hypothetical protein
VHGLAKDKSTVGGESYYNLPSSITVDFGKKKCVMFGINYKVLKLILKF